jgi:hypothetical protein
MTDKFQLVKQFLMDMDLPIIKEDEAEQILIVDHEEAGIKHLILDCEDTLLIMEQAIMPTPAEPGDLFKSLLIWNRSLVHGAFVLDENGETIIFRDTLQLENLDRNELEGSIRALELALAEYSPSLLAYHG